MSIQHSEPGAASAAIGSSATTERRIPLTTGNQEDDPLDFWDEPTSKSAQIEAAIQSEHWENARVAIEETLSAMPADWNPSQTRWFR